MTFVTTSLKRKKNLILIKSSLLFNFSFMFYALIFLILKILPIPRLQIFSPRSFIILAYIQVYKEFRNHTYVGCEVCVSIPFSPSKGYPITPAPFEFFLVSVNFLGTFLKNQLNVHMWVYFWTLLFSTEPHVRPCDDTHYSS